MRYAVLAFPLLVAACAADLPEAPVSAAAADTVVVSRTITVEASDGATFEVTVVHDGTVTPGVETAVVEGVQVVPVAEAVGVGGGVGVGGQFVSPVDARFFPDPSRGFGIFVESVDPGVLVGNYRWAWIDDINAEDVEATVDVLCPPWH